MHEFEQCFEHVLQCYSNIKYTSELFKVDSQVRHTLTR